ncbi:MAG: ribonuclease III [Holosporales bacterium]|jgi:ribonuclease-3|nr:ribonuclease III [Holosporales bacterium]
MSKVSRFQEILGHRFSDEALLRAALVHSSVACGDRKREFDRLEFLGDRIINLLIAECLYKKFPAEHEGALAHRYSKLVCFEICAEVAEDIGLPAVLDVAAKTNFCDMRVLCDALEAVVGAMYLDGGLQVCKDFVEKHWKAMLEDCSSPPPCDPKSELQEFAQSKWKTLPVYDVVDRTGADHAPLYKVTVRIVGVEMATDVGVGRSKKVAEKDAARNLLDKIKKQVCLC